MSRRLLVNQLHDARENFGGLGTRTVKLKLNKLAKTCSTARAFRLALEIEDCSTLGKKYHGEWSDHYFNRKHALIHELIEIFQAENWTFGKHEMSGFPPFVIYFEIPGCEQISFHTKLDAEVPDYQKEWDGKRNSTFGKLESAIIKYLGIVPF